MLQQNKRQYPIINYLDADGGSLSVGDLLADVLGFTSTVGLSFGSEISSERNKKQEITAAGNIMKYESFCV